MSIFKLSGRPGSGAVASCIAAVLGASVLTGLAIPERVVAAPLVGVQYNYSVAFAANVSSETKTITPVTPAGKVLVIQNISIYRFPSSNSTLQTFLGVGGGFIALSDVAPTADTYPAATTNLTSYVQAGQTAYVNMYRTGGSLPAETAYVTVTGYLNAD